jgi:5-methylcytosine-specific restriction endonuclease McrA
MEKRDRYLIAAFRRVFRWDTLRRECLKRSGGRCAKCNKKVKLVVDHIIPVFDLADGFEGWDILYRRLFCRQDNLQALCLDCHKAKTKKENTIRRKHRSKK